MTEQEVKKVEALIRAAGVVAARKSLVSALNMAASSDRYAGVFALDGRLLTLPALKLEALGTRYRTRLVAIGALVRPALQALRQQKIGTEGRRSVEAKALGNPVRCQMRIDLDKDIVKSIHIMSLGAESLAFAVIGTHDDAYEAEQTIQLDLQEIEAGFADLEKAAHIRERP